MKQVPSVIDRSRRGVAVCLRSDGMRSSESAVKHGLLTSARDASHRRVYPMPMKVIRHLPWPQHGSDNRQIRHPPPPHPTIPPVCSWRTTSCSRPPISNDHHHALTHRQWCRHRRSFDRCGKRTVGSVEYAWPWKRSRSIPRFSYGASEYWLY